MSNGNNNGHHGNGTGNGLAHLGGNGHKPDAAPVSSTGQAIVTEHDLLWDGLSPAVTEALGQPLDPALASQRKGRGGKSYDYLEGHAVIDQANRIFGFGGWGYELTGDVTLRRIETVDARTGEVTVASRLQRAGAGHRRWRAAPHGHRGTPGGRGQHRRPRHGHQGLGDGRPEAGVPQLRRPVRQRLLRRPGFDKLRGGPAQPQRTCPPSSRSPVLETGPTAGPGRPGRPTAGPASPPRPTGATTPRRRSCASGSSRSPPGRASTRTRCAPPS